MLAVAALGNLTDVKGGTCMSATELVTQSRERESSQLKKPELLAPAGNLEKLQFAVRYGADAVYIGGQQYGLRL